MSISSAQVSVDTTAGGTALHSVESDDQPGYAVLIRNKHASLSVYLGPSGVTTGTGFELAAGEAVSLDLRGGEVVYGITASSSATVHVMRAGA